MAEFKEAINLNPSFAAAHVLLGQRYLFEGLPEEAITSAEKGIRLNPRDPRQFIWLPVLAGAHYQHCHYGQAVEIGLRACSLNPNWLGGLRYVAAGLGQLGRIEGAESALAALRAHEPTLPSVQAKLTRAYRHREGVDHVLGGLGGLGKAEMPKK